MKIGPVDVTVPLIAYTGGCVAGIIVLLTMWSRNSDLRSEAMKRGTILRAMYDDDGDKVNDAIEKCRSLATAYPNRTNARLSLATLLYKKGEYSEAQKEFSEITQLGSATTQEKAWASVGVGVSIFAAAPKDGKAKAAVEAEKYFTDALATEPKCVDAIINLAVVQLHKGGNGSIQLAAKYCDQARDAMSKGGAENMPSLKAMEQFYVVSGIVSAQLGKPVESVVALESARSIKPNSKFVEENRRLSALVAVTQENVDSAKRKQLAQSIESGASKYPKELIPSAYNAAGIGYWRLHGLPEYSAGLAEACFERAIDYDKNDLRGYLNKLALFDEQLMDLARKASTPLPGFTGDVAAQNPWLVDTEKPVRFAKNDAALLVEMKTLLKKQEDLFRRFIDKSSASGEAKNKARIRLLANARRQFLLLEGDEENLRNGFQSKAQVIAKDLLTNAPNDPEAHFANGMFLLDKQPPEFLAAYASFKTAAEKGMKTPDLENLLAKLGAPPVVDDARPREDRRSLGPKPIVFASLKAIMATGGFKNATMKIGLREVKPVLVGSQVLYLPPDSELPDGETTVVIGVVDGMGQSVECKPYTFNVDKQPPTVRVEPDPAAPLPVKPLFNITLSDKSGVDFSSLNITFKAADGKKTSFNKDLVKDGRCKIAMPNVTPPLGTGAAIAAETFQISTGPVDLKPGEYDMTISIQDLAGNTANETKRYSVK